MNSVGVSEMMVVLILLVVFLVLRSLLVSVVVVVMFIMVGDSNVSCVFGSVWCMSGMIVKFLVSWVSLVIMGMLLSVLMCGFGLEVILILSFGVCMVVV